MEGKTLESHRGAGEIESSMPLSVKARLFNRLEDAQTSGGLFLRYRPFISDRTTSAVVLIRNTGTIGILGHFRMASTPIGMLTAVVNRPRRTMKPMICQSRSLRPMDRILTRSHGSRQGVLQGSNSNERAASALSATDFLRAARLNTSLLSW